MIGTDLVVFREVCGYDPFVFLLFPFQEDETEVSEEVKETWVSDKLVTVPLGLSLASCIGDEQICAHVGGG